MRFTPVALGGPMIIDLDAHEDERGSFARTFCAAEFAQAGLPACFVQCSLSRNPRRGTLRGLHYQAPPREEGKLVRCTRGAIWDVAVDLRRNSVTCGRWVAEELSAENQRALWVPPGFAHGFVTLCDDTDVFYQMTAPYCPELSAGVRWDDPAFGIAWPVRDPWLSERDRRYPDWVTAPRRCGTLLEAAALP
ncbi:MAG TPA: dTDP-4-dehydrorhamnose 3,5-epimerase, partial [Acetobacteraceae bacterium]|nr:dTDP-4-dehydrorhamnose 3,5-epimerase [Acetobacteraceae bacterium]